MIILMDKPWLLILVGPPGSGKTHFAERFSQQHGFLHINSDQVRMKYFVDPTFTPEERIKVYAKMNDLISEALRKGKNVIFDGNLITNDDREEALNLFDPLGQVLFVYLDTPKEIALERAVTRKLTDDKLYKPMPMERVKKMHERFESLDTSRLPGLVVSSEIFETLEKSILNRIDLSS